MIYFNSTNTQGFGNKEAIRKNDNPHLPCKKLYFIKLQDIGL